MRMLAAHLLAVRVESPAGHDGAFFHLAGHLDQLGAVAVGEEEVFVGIAVVMPLHDLDLGLVEHRMDVLLLEAGLMQIPMIAHEGFAGGRFPAGGIDAAAVEVEVLFLDGRLEYLHQPFGRNVRRDGFHRVPALLDLVHGLFAHEGAGQLVLLVIAGHDASIHIQAVGLHHPAPGEGGLLVLAGVGRFHDRTRYLAQHLEGDGIADGGVHLTAVALHGLVGGQPAAGVELDEIEARGRFAREGVFTGGTNELIGRIDHLVDDDVLADDIGRRALHGIGRREGGRQHFQRSQLLLPGFLALASEALTHLLFVAEIRRHVGRDLHVIALALQKGRARALEQSLYGRIVGIALHEALHPVHGVALVAVERSRPAVLMRDLFFKFFQIVFRARDLVFRCKSRRRRRQRRRPEQDTDGKKDGCPFHGSSTAFSVTAT